jgi:predicted HAD superfamily Cof-like phosphohydrolase
MEKQILQVKQFQDAFAVKMPNRPKLLSKKRSEFRHKLLQEEVDEIKKGAEELDIVQVADGIIDSMYILIGTAHEYGIADRLVLLFDEVHRSNMSKMGSDGKAIFRPDGKVLKPESYSPPKLDKIIQRDFSMYKENDILQEIAREQKQLVEDKIRKNVLSGLNFFERLSFLIIEKIENRLKKKIEVIFPVNAFEKIKVKVKGKEYEVE